MILMFYKYIYIYSICMYVCVFKALGLKGGDLKHRSSLERSQRKRLPFLLDAMAGTSWCTGKTPGIHAGSAWVKDPRGCGAPGMWTCNRNIFRKRDCILMSFNGILVWIYQSTPRLYHSTCCDRWNGNVLLYTMVSIFQKRLAVLG